MRGEGAIKPHKRATTSAQLPPCWTFSSRYTISAQIIARPRYGNFMPEHVTSPPHFPTGFYRFAKSEYSTGVCRIAKTGFFNRILLICKSRITLPEPVTLQIMHFPIESCYCAEPECFIGRFGYLPIRKSDDIQVSAASGIVNTGYLL